MSCYTSSNIIVYPLIPIPCKPRRAAADSPSTSRPSPGRSACSSAKPPVPPPWPPGRSRSPRSWRRGRARAPNTKASRLLGPRNASERLEIGLKRPWRRKHRVATPRAQICKAPGRRAPAEHTLQEILEPLKEASRPFGRFHRLRSSFQACCHVFYVVFQCFLYVFYCFS